MTEIPLTQGKFAIVDDSDVKLVTQFNWKYSNQGYAARNYQVKGKYKTMLMHRLILDPPDGTLVDHIDGNPLNNTRNNLRLATSQENARNQRISSRNTSGYKGINKRKNYNKWSASIRGDDRKQIHLGDFDNPHDAARMYNFWAHDIYGEFAQLNVIREEANA